MDLIVSIIMGILAGFIACKLSKQEGQGCLINLALGVVGGFVGGWLFGLLGLTFINPSWLGSLITSVIGAVIVLWIWNKLFK